ncbi:putative membrane protein [Pectobacterium atrosepticum SCRI1043]|uniref:Membrane protein n=1 Tax=Pectobacterium atrosepticum (strain SCRI 1043 / ATCC BAA-672) TaxID=218491 RepID=Q6D3H9_PECAS|nr:threonine/homoserine exporter RhtA [Pectobacterium atrosepticum]GKV84946.1 threonine/homoserine exporter RhtA [Pectobacterium carotovorum subsp. carotovorum]AIA71583.1 threonine transporter [Pectobacterium atrosepticum]AIK13613.1 Threonine/homoserine exporter [Pectobacterium atrosepticum]ATY90498.1 threonine/homoserine exporter RhtA [Pectobacterium atrosepticum]KFX16282.1 threonine transporter [Pectobacterium atrosepticum]
MTLFSHRSSSFVPVLLIIISMLSIQSGAALAKSLFPLIGATGVTALRLGIGTIILCIIFKPWRMRFSSNRLPLLVYGITLGGMNFLFYLSLQTVPLGIAVALEFTGPLAVAMLASRRPIDFLWVFLAVAGLWFLLPLGHNIGNVDLTGAACAVGAGACWALYILFGQKAGANHGPGTVAVGSCIAALIFCPIGVYYAESTLFSFSILPLGIAVAILSTALPYSLEMVALTRLPARTFSTLMSMEPAIAALSGILFLGEHLAFIQWMALMFIIIASIGATLTIKSAGATKATTQAE